MDSVYRTASFFTTWSAEILRQPAMMLSLVLGPFLILLAFGQGVDISRVEPRVIVVQAIEEEQELQPVPEELEDYVEVVDVTRDLGAARQEVREGNIDGVVVIPRDPETAIEAGEHVPLEVLTSDIDPLRRRLTEGYLNEQVAALNQRTLADFFGEAQQSFEDVHEQVTTAREFVAAAQSARGDVEDVRQWIADLNQMLGPIVEVSDSLSSAVETIPFFLPGFGNPRDDVRDLQRSLNSLSETVASLDRQLNESDEPLLPSEAELDQIDQDLARIEETGNVLGSVPPEVLSAPFELQLENVAPFVPDFAAFYAPAVLALLLQHLGISLAALSATRLRQGGLLDMLRITPARPVEVANGNFLSFGMLLLIAAAVILALMMLVLDVPIHGSYLVLALAIVLLTVLSLGIGFVLAMISTSEKHAAQLAMLILLASVFFSGLVISLDRIGWPMRAVSYLLPSTYAIQSFQDVMLRGLVRSPLDLVILGVAAVVFYILTVLLLKRRFRSV